MYICATQGEAPAPYRLKSSSLQLYSIEEALYHTYHNWMQVGEEFLEEGFLEWLKSRLGLLELAEGLTRLRTAPSLKDKLAGFLSYNGYFNADELDSLTNAVYLWENQHVWEQLKKQGDYLFTKAAYPQAIESYAAALAHVDDAKADSRANIYSNIGISHMHMGHYDKAATSLKKAITISPKRPYYYHLIEAHILAENYEQARGILDSRLEHDEHEAYYFYGQWHSSKKQYFEAIKMYQKAIDMHYDAGYIYELCKAFIKIRLYDRAFATLEQVQEKDSMFYRKQAEFYAQTNNYPLAIKSTERAIFYDNKNAELWTYLAYLRRLDYDLGAARGAISTALSLAPDSARSLLEQARIRKAQGRTKDYQQILDGLLTQFKQDYRAKEDYDTNKGASI